MKTLGHLLIVLGVISTIYLLVTAPIIGDIFFLLGYLAIPLLIILIGVLVTYFSNRRSRTIK